jgi:hypothetical protein
MSILEADASLITIKLNRMKEVVGVSKDGIGLGPINFRIGRPTGIDLSKYNWKGEGKRQA